MFTGIVQGLGRLTSLTPKDRGLDLSIEAEFDWGDPLALGESISVSGTCLTVTRFGGREFTAHVSAESLQRTIIGRARVGDRFNLERALRLSDRLGGHLVSGHIDGLSMIKEKRPAGDSLVFHFGLEPRWSGYVIEKGSVAVDGVSLTVNQVWIDSFSVNVIPHTAQMTTLDFKKAGDYVNLETDLIGKYVARLLGREPGGSRLDENFLAEHGFL